MILPRTDGKGSVCGTFVLCNQTGHNHTRNEKLFGSSAALLPPIPAATSLHWEMKKFLLKLQEELPRNFKALWLCCSNWTSGELNVRMRSGGGVHFPPCFFKL